jgi:hypothetical protein
MTFALFSDVRETSTAPGTSAFSLNGAYDGSYFAFSARYANGDTGHYYAKGTAGREIGKFTYNSSGNTLTRTIIKSTNADAAVNFSSGTVDIGVTNIAPSDLSAGQLEEFRAVLGLAAGQFPATATNDDAASGKVGESGASGAATGAQSTVTMTIANPCVVTWTGHKFSTGMVFRATTTGALPNGGTTNIVSNQSYFTIKIDANTFWLASSAANALAGTKISTLGGSQSGTHTGFNTANLTTDIPACINALSLTAGDWIVWASSSYAGGSTTTLNYAINEVNLSEATINQIPGMFGKLSGYGPSGTAGQVFNNSSGFVLDAGPMRVSLAVTTTIFLNVQVGFGASTASVGGALYARRAR